MLPPTTKLIGKTIDQRRKQKTTTNKKHGWIGTLRVAFVAKVFNIFSPQPQPCFLCYFTFFWIQKKMREKKTSINRDKVALYEKNMKEIPLFRGWSRNSRRRILNENTNSSGFWGLPKLGWLGIWMIHSLSVPEKKELIWTVKLDKRHFRGIKFGISNWIISQSNESSFNGLQVLNAN